MVNSIKPQGPKLIKRYANRKLYDTEHSCYVTLEEIADMVKDGEDLRIVDNRTGEDLTSVTLTQIIYEDQKKPNQKSVLPLVALRSIIQSGGEIFSRLTPRKSDEPDPQTSPSSRYDGPYERYEAYGELHQPRYTSWDPNSELRLEDIFEVMVRMEQRMGRLERQIKGLTQQMARMGEEVKRQGQRQGMASRQKSNPTLPL